MHQAKLYNASNSHGDDSWNILKCPQPMQPILILDESSHVYSDISLYQARIRLVLRTPKHTHTRISAVYAHTRVRSHARMDEVVVRVVFDPDRENHLGEGQRARKVS